MKRTLPLALLLLAAPRALAQSDEPAPIQDNSFLIEEAYNQERGVVQHINTFSRAFEGGGWAYAFTQEWPLFSPLHQLSFTVPLEDTFGGTGIGDVAINYRYQLVGDGASPAAVSPRLSLLLPTGDEEQGRGAGGVGVQAALPVSLVLSDRLVSHTNAGVTWTPAARNELGDEAATAGVFVGQSLVWLAHPKANFLVEALWGRDEAVVGEDEVAEERSLYISPGVRFAIDFPSGLQVVPGIAVPIGVGPSDGERSVFLYLSLEHAFNRNGR